MKRELTSKRSQGHIEMILSFVIFVGFVFTLFIFFTPVRQETVSYASLENTQINLFAYAVVDYTFVSIILNITDGGNNYQGGCISIEDILSANGNPVVKDLSGNILNSYRSGSRIYIQAYSDRYYKIYFSNLFNPSLTILNGCEPLNKNVDYAEAVISSEKEVFYDKINSTEKEYIANYSKLKSDLGLINDFEFVVYNSTYGILMNNTLSVHKLKTFPVLSRDIPIRALTNKGEYKDLILTIRVWQ
ncbi:MAG: hypothetical protein AABX17_01645 [Nanoarchaeota archaeon]